MDREILFKAKHEHVVVANKDLEPFCYPMPLTDFHIKANKMEVIGNMFDNPELLEEV